MKICFVHVLCWKILKSFVRWLPLLEHTLLTCSHQKVLNISVPNVIIMQNTGNQQQINYGKKTAENITRNILRIKI